MITRMKKWMVALVILATVAACATSPTGRKQLLLMPDDQLDQMGVAAYAQMKQKQPVVQDSPASRYVQCVTSAVLRTIPDGQGWEVNVFKDDSANAFALPGKKIGVNTGLLDIAENQDQLATVIGHEIAHVLAKHGNERMSIQFATQTGLQVLQQLSGDDPQKKALVMAALGMGAQFGVVLPFSREHESESDVIGLRLMAQAGFDPRASVKLWQNMARASGGSPPQFLSTHPSHNTRIEELKENMDEALALYQAARQRGIKPACQP